MILKRVDVGYISVVVMSVDCYVLSTAWKYSDNMRWQSGSYTDVFRELDVLDEPSDTLSLIRHVIYY